VLRAALVTVGEEGDLSVISAGAALLIVTALAAALGPALRATRIDPKAALQAQ
jgi:ABC-type antimicrobial peptide transport system permease subunit